MASIRTISVLALALGILALGPTTALGARVEVARDRYELDPVHFVAARGETNHVSIGRSSDEEFVDVVDRGAALHAGRHCRRIRRHHVRCRAFESDVRISTRDRNDTIRVRRDGPNLVADAGSGNDLVRGASGFDEIDGGAGRDVLDGGGHGGLDTVVYSSHRRAVRVHLGDGRSDGSAGEGDALRRFSNIRGGRGPDVLIGDGNRNVIEGGRGRDWLEGRGGVDDLNGDAGADFARCGRGEDNVSPIGGDFVAPDCESLVFGDLDNGGDNWMRPYPRVRRGHVSFRVPCPDPSSEGDNLPCGGRISLRTDGGRLLGRARIKRHRHEELPVRLHLTPLGRRMAARRLGVRAHVHVNGLNLPHYRWQIRLRVP